MLWMVVNKFTGELEDGCSFCSMGASSEDIDLSSLRIPHDHIAVELTADEYNQMLLCDFDVIRQEPYLIAGYGGDELALTEPTAKVISNLNTDGQPSDVLTGWARLHCIDTEKATRKYSERGTVQVPYFLRGYGGDELALVETQIEQVIKNRTQRKCFSCHIEGIEKLKEK